VEGVKALRNILIVALLAFGIAFLPMGGNLFEAFMTLLLIGFLAAIAWTVARFAQRNELALSVLDDGRRLLLYAAVAVLVLLIAGSERFFETGLGTVAWLVLLVGSVAVAWRVWREANTY
jgi:hypothetical protein